MSEKAYTVAELDHLRVVVEHRYLYGTYNSYPSASGRGSRTYQASEKVISVEQMVRTHMLAGHTAEDLLASEPAPNWEATGGA